MAYNIQNLYVCLILRDICIYSQLYIYIYVHIYTHAHMHVLSIHKIHMYACTYIYIHTLYVL